VERLRVLVKMFKRSFHAAVSKDKAGKARKISKRSFRDDAKMRMYVLSVFHTSVKFTVHRGRWYRICISVAMCEATPTSMIARACPVVCTYQSEIDYCAVRVCCS